MYVVCHRRLSASWLRRDRRRAHEKFLVAWFHNHLSHLSAASGTM
jgi:hypothetical protein